MKTIMQKRIMNYQLDSFNMVHHARYLELMEEGRWLYCYENNLMDEFNHRGIYHVIVNININYQSSATLGDLITIHTELLNVTAKSVVVKQTLCRDEHVLVTGNITNVYLSKTDNAVILPKEMAPFWKDIQIILKGLD